MSKQPDLKLVETESEESDGRRRRSERSRRKIVDAMLALLREGDMHPSAASVAERAGVSLRTVFRHFDDKESLYREMGAIVEAEILPLLLRPIEARGWRNQLRIMIERRIEIFERIMPVRVAASLLRFRSDYLMDDYRRFIAVEQSALESLLPKKITASPSLFAALAMATSFAAWRRLRQDQGLSPAEAEGVVFEMTERLTKGA